MVPARALLQKLGGLGAITTAELVPARHLEHRSGLALRGLPQLHERRRLLLEDLARVRHRCLLGFAVLLALFVHSARLLFLLPEVRQIGLLRCERLRGDALCALVLTDRLRCASERALLVIPLLRNRSNERFLLVAQSREGIRQLPFLVDAGLLILTEGLSQR